MSPMYLDCTLNNFDFSDFKRLEMSGGCTSPSIPPYRISQHSVCGRRPTLGCSAEVGKRSRSFHSAHAGRPTVPELQSNQTSHSKVRSCSPVLQHSFRNSCRSIKFRLFIKLWHEGGPGCPVTTWLTQHFYWSLCELRSQLEHVRQPCSEQSWFPSNHMAFGTERWTFDIFHISDQPRAAHFFRSRIKRQYNGEGDEILRRFGGRPNCGRQRTEEGVQVNHQPSLEVRN